MARIDAPAPLALPGRGPPAPPGAARGRSLRFALAVLTALVLRVAGAPLDGPLATSLACAALLLGGLPHGTFDIELLRREHALGPGGTARALALYVGLAAATYALWRLDGTLALVAFLGVATVHFAEDWDDLGSPFLATGTALALFAAPALAQRAAVDGLFVAVAGTPRAVLATDLLVLVAPIALAAALVGAIARWQQGRRREAGEGLLALAGMLLLPPAVGFALFFLGLHSPRHFGEGLAAMGRPAAARWAPVVVPLTLAALGIAALVYRLAGAPDPAAGMVAASFVTLSLLTVPHMAVPLLLRR